MRGHDSNAMPPIAERFTGTVLHVKTFIFSSAATASKISLHFCAKLSSVGRNSIPTAYLPRSGSPSTNFLKNSSGI
ncbi:unknown [Coraliomargarita sp. CAG:312]|nr:unknown [Coraliomargarita sp. CAG:312]